MVKQVLWYLKKVLTYFRSLIRRRMGLLDNMENVAFYSNNPVDMVFLSDTTYSHTVPGRSGSNGTVISTIPHGETTTPLFDMLFSLDQINWYPNNGLDEKTYGPTNLVYSVMYSDDTNIYLYSENTSVTARTVYFKYNVMYKGIS